MPYILDGQNVYYDDEKITELVGPLDKVETVRIDASTVADVTYQFDLNAGVYAEQSRVTRAEPLPPAPPTMDEQINELKSQNADIIFALVSNNLM